MSKRTAKNSKDEWRRKKKLAQLASPRAVQVDTKLDMKKVMADAQKRLTREEFIEFGDLFLGALRADVERYDQFKEEMDEDLAREGKLQGVGEAWSAASDEELLASLDGLGEDQAKALQEAATKWADKVNQSSAKKTAPNYQKYMADARANVRARKQPVRQLQSQKRATPEEQTVDNLLVIQSHTLDVTRRADSAESRADAMQKWMAIKDARAFHIGKETYAVVHQEADRFTTELVGLPFIMNIRKTGPTKEENDKYTWGLIKAAKNQPFPDKLPFPSIFLGYGAGVNLPSHMIDLKSPESIKGDVLSMTLLGHCLTSKQEAIAFFHAHLKIRTGKDLPQEVMWGEVMHTGDGGGWPRSIDLEPWTLPHLVRLINDHRTFIEEVEVSGAIRKTIKESHKELGIEDYKHIPKPYYKLKMDTRTIKEKVRRQLGKPAQPRKFKTDVRAHERCKVRRGKLPLDPKLAEKLTERGYTIYSSTALDQEAYHRLLERGMPYKMADEWLAIKAIWVKEHYSSSDPNLPYIPAVRTMDGPKGEPKQLTGSWAEDPRSPNETLSSRHRSRIRSCSDLHPRDSGMGGHRRRGF